MISEPNRKIVCVYEDDLLDIQSLINQHKKELDEFIATVLKLQADNIRLFDETQRLKAYIEENDL